ncbi:MAG: hypothetical protein ACYC8W_01215 [Candidatus Tyrphobacter sp.]
MELGRLAGAVAVLLLASGAGQASQAAGGASTSRVQAAYDAQCVDLLRGDFADFARTLSPSFTAHVEGQTYSRDQVVTSLKSASSSITLTKCTTSVDSVTQSNDVLIALVRQLVDGTHGNQPFELASGKRDMWSGASTVLIETSSTALWSTTSINGQIVQQSGLVPSPLPQETPTPRARL